MKVYVAMYDFSEWDEEYEDAGNFGEKFLKVFSTREKAEEYIRNYRGDDGPGHPDIWITEDELPDLYKKYSKEIEEYKRSVYERFTEKYSTYEDFLKKNSYWMTDEYCLSAIQYNVCGQFCIMTEQDSQGDKYLRDVRVQYIESPHGYDCGFYIKEEEVE